MNDRMFIEPLIQTIYNAMIEREWPSQACTIADLMNEGMRNPRKGDEGIILLDAYGKNQWWLGLDNDPVNHEPVVKVCGLDIIDMFWAPIENYKCDLSRCLDEIDQYINQPVLVHDERLSVATLDPTHF